MQSSAILGGVAAAAMQLPETVMQLHGAAAAAKQLRGRGAPASRGRGAPAPQRGQLTLDQMRYFQRQVADLQVLFFISVFL